MENTLLNLYQLSPTFDDVPSADNDPWRDRMVDWCVEMIVAAPSESEARELAFSGSRDEGGRIWRDTTFTKCELIGTAAEHFTTPKILMRDIL